MGRFVGDDEGRDVVGILVEGRFVGDFNGREVGKVVEGRCVGDLDGERVGRLVDLGRFDGDEDGLAIGLWLGFALGELVITGAGVPDTGGQGDPGVYKCSLNNAQRFRHWQPLSWPPGLGHE